MFHNDLETVMIRLKLSFLLEEENKAKLQLLRGGGSHH